MFGQGFPLGEPDFWDGAGVLGVVDVFGVVDVLDGVEVVGVLVVVVLCVVVAAPALAMPAAAPPVASAPATMVAPSSLEMFIGLVLLGRVGVCRPWWARTLSASAGVCRACVRALVWP